LICPQMLPVIDKSQSDSGSYDNVLEFLYHGSDRSLPECMLMMIPEPWQVIYLCVGSSCLRLCLRVCVCESVFLG